MKPLNERLKDILNGHAQIADDRANDYADSTGTAAAIMNAAFPDGFCIEPGDELAYRKWILFTLAMIKLGRFINSGLTHHDSACDSSMYWTMIEDAINLINKQESEK